MRRLCVFLALLILLFVCASAQAEPQILPIETVISDRARMRYPQISGLENEAAQQKINDDIAQQAEIMRFFPVLMRQTDQSFGLVMDYEATIFQTIVSVKIIAKGEMPTGQEGNRVYALTYDLTSGERVPFSALTSDETEAVAYLESELNRTLADELTGYMEAADITPLPKDAFYLDKQGITFCYPESQLLYISGYAGQARFSYDELWEILDTSEGGLLASNGIVPKVYTITEALTGITDILSFGRLPDLPVHIGDSLKTAIDDYRLLRDPDMQPGGRVYQLEDAAFRGVQLISDALSGGYEDSKVKGIQATRCSLYGISTGKTTLDECQGILGKPASIVPFTEAMAYDYALPLGTAAYYAFGDYQLRLYFDQDNILYSVMLTK